MSILMHASSMERQPDNTPEQNLPAIVAPPEVVTANVRTSENTQRIDTISRKSTGPKMRIGMTKPPVGCDRNHGGGCCDKVSSNCATVAAVSLETFPLLVVASEEAAVAVAAALAFIIEITPPLNFDTKSPMPPPELPPNQPIQTTNKEQ
mmetsp:Transcript_11744/g.18612  ORF Transcript_11744/g.18612 Transcript_11744/m.18612 type:complete len:150 (+) Transcript_11744:608-1057(+)